ncbi:MAG: phosphatase PAP2 family protein [Clostridiales Family XIII bacterium]|jgi:undecaprenyl-diphosphatase|nr:phosphatase PAP2 family protein [Clostridiales Family XIII bacterium]
MEYYKQSSNSNAKWIVLIMLAALFAADLWSVITGFSRPFDLGVMQFAYDIRDDFLNVIATFITRAGDTVTIAVICAVLAVLPTRARFGIPAAGAAVVAGLTHYVIKNLVERARPDEAMWLIPEDGFSFPSGHANASFVFYLFLMILLRRYFIIGGSYGAANLVSVAMPLLVAVISASRIYLGVHYPTDIIGGWLLGSILLIIIISLYDNFYPMKNKITFDAPSWEYTRRRRPWRKPQVSNSPEEMLDFPKDRSIWRRPATTAKRRAVEEEKRRRDENDPKH